MAGYTEMAPEIHKYQSGNFILLFKKGQVAVTRLVPSDTLVIKSEKDLSSWVIALVNVVRKSSVG